MKRLITAGCAIPCLYVSYQLFHLPHPIIIGIATCVGIGGLILSKQAIVGKGKTNED